MALPLFRWILLAHIVVAVAGISINSNERQSPTQQQQQQSGNQQQQVLVVEDAVAQPLTSPASPKQAFIFTLSTRGTIEGNLLVRVNNSWCCLDSPQQDTDGGRDGFDGGGGASDGGGCFPWERLRGGLSGPESIVITSGTASQLELTWHNAYLGIIAGWCTVELSTSSADRSTTAVATSKVGVNWM